MGKNESLNLNALLAQQFLSQPAKYPNSAFQRHQGVGMTSQRTRDRLIRRLVDLGITDQSVLNAMRVVPRHLFLDEAMGTRSYEDTALPIGYGQTISQPIVVATMTQWLLADRTNETMNKVLEIGTGSGYQTAVLSLLVDKLFSVERIEPLMKKAKDVIASLDLSNITFDLSDGHWGWPSNAPFDGIISAAAPEKLPEELITQLRTGGRLVMPIGEKEQLLYGFIKTSTGVKETCLGEVLFVPMKQGIEA
ncbi:protein-L-isoaspartate(D-aspartate) O-methyltransferase [Thiomicrorhabdus sp. ZW0627]|uniref:protein-L-isoaspartate(D-aspartate) O-methyltransferase n=1 Tax=Thiomicrorhabdus sp. ZW0627 TaxID=3039774 RepID=UPI0024371360|nr:protein-L-isoaspartate(D-aspartate) O-methyltransferase [Thiomicrorhabdus sp. ZW0627]MDG6772973.1 protein-L-isoaspartate(D-aspartate) O-methyltransferase [Thiomicrorhabdus sp. ZW0627]